MSEPKVHTFMDKQQGSFAESAPGREDVVLIYTNRLLPYSETFIRDHGRYLERYSPHYVGCRCVADGGIALPSTTQINDGTILGLAREVRFKLTGRDPLLLRELGALRPRLLHAHFGGCAAIALPIAEQMDIPFVVTYHGLDATRTRSDRRRQPNLTSHLYLHRLERLRRRVDMVLTVTEYMRQMVIQEGYPDDSVRVHNLGIDTSFFSPDPKVDREPIVLFVGRLVEKKGCDYLIRAMAEVQRQIPDVELVVIGDGPERPLLERDAAKALVRCRFLGRRDPSDVLHWMRRASVLSVPSIIADSGDREGFGIVFLEAQAVGTPVVSFASGGIPEAVAEGNTGYLVPEKDVAALGARIVHLMTDKATWRAFSERGIVRIREQFDAVRQGRRLEELYDEILDVRASREKPRRRAGVSA